MVHVQAVLYMQALWNQAKPILKGLRNGLEYGSRVRFVHSLVMVFLFKSFNHKTIKSIFKNAWEHGKKLGTFVFFYKLLCLALAKIMSQRPLNSFIAGFVVGGLVFGPKTPINYQINLYLFSRIMTALVEMGYNKMFPNEGEGEVGNNNNNNRGNNNADNTRKYAFRVLAGVVWGLVMWLFYVDQSVLQDSLASSMRHLYISSQKPVVSWKEFIPYSSHK